MDLFSLFAEVAIPDGKLKKSLLESGDVFIVSSSKIFIWVGSGSSLEEKKEAFPKTVAFMKENGIPASTAVERVSEGNESSSFKAEFSEWSAPVSFTRSAGATAKAADTPVDIAALLQRKAVEDVPLDDGSGNVKIWSIQNFAKVEVPVEKYGQFFGGDSYLILYTYIKNKKENQIIYFWLGRDSTNDEQGTAALLAKELDTELGGSPVQIRVTQGKEPPHFRQIFKGRMIVHAGGHASSFKNSSESATMNESGTALFHVHGTTALNTYAVEVKAAASSLNSQDTFVLVTSGIIFVWKGASTNADEVEVASNIANIFRDSIEKGSDITVICEETEPEDFWNALGGKTEYSKLAPGEPAPRDPRLFEATNKSGAFRVDEIDNFDQSDLNDEDVYILDTYTQLFVWVGSQASAEEKSKSSEAAKKFVSQATDGRDADIPIIVVHAGSEPSIFSSQFTLWDPEYAKNRAFVDPYTARLEALAATNAKKNVAGEATAVKLKKTEAPAAKAATPAPAPTPAPVAAVAAAPDASAVAYKTPAQTGLFSLEVLKAGAPAGIDPSRKEEYLNDAEFATAIGCDKKAFAAQPKWKRDQKKKELGIF